MITDEQLAQLEHIPDDEVRRDIADTEGEIAQLRAQSKLLALRIDERAAFVVKLTALLEARQERRARAHPDA